MTTDTVRRALEAEAAGDNLSATALVWRVAANPTAPVLEHRAAVEAFAVLFDHAPVAAACWLFLDQTEKFAEAALRSSLASCRARALRVKGRLDEAASSYISCGWFAHAAACRGEAGNLEGAAGSWLQAAEASRSEDLIVSSLATLRASTSYRRAGLDADRQALYARATTSLVDLATNEESSGRGDRASEIFRALATVALEHCDSDLVLLAATRAASIDTQFGFGPDAAGFLRYLGAVATRMSLHELSRQLYGVAVTCGLSGFEGHRLRFAARHAASAVAAPQSPESTDADEHQRATAQAQDLLRGQDWMTEGDVLHWERSRDPYDVCCAVLMDRSIEGIQRRFALRAAFEAARPRSLKPHLRDLHIAQWLGRGTAYAALPCVERLYPAGDTAVKAAFLQSVRQQCFPKTVDLILLGLAETDPELRRLSLDLLANLACTSARIRLVPLFWSTKDPEVREAILRAVERSEAIRAQP